MLRVEIDFDRCDGCEICKNICPKNCYDADREKRKIRMSRGYKCVRCGACIVQCPEDALCFSDPHGNKIPPEVIRRFKLNLMGKRIVKV